MRSNRPTYSAAPAGSAKALAQKPRPRRPKQEWNQLFLMLFFIVLPVLGLLAVFFQPVRWIFMIVTVVSLVMMWLMHAFLFPGRMIVTAVYGLLLVFTLVSALGAQSSPKVRQQNFFASVPTAGPTQIPQIVTYNSGDAMSGLMDNALDELAEQEMGLTGGSMDQSQQDLGVTDTGATGYISSSKSEAEIALENFMEKWRKGIIADMVSYTPPSWRTAQADSAQQQLFWKFAQRPLVEWRQMAAPTGTMASTARTITVEADVNYGGETRTYQYDAIALCEMEGGSEKWFIDPDSLSSGILVIPATPTPDPNITPTPSPAPTPTPAPSKKTKLYYNKDGGKMYHADPNCASVAQKYLPLSGSFTYGDLNKSPYTRLEPCDKCEAPHR